MALRNNQKQAEMTGYLTLETKEPYSLVFMARFPLCMPQSSGMVQLELRKKASVLMPWSVRRQSSEFKATGAVEIDGETLKQREPQKGEIYILHINSPQTLIGHLQCAHAGRTPRSLEEKARWERERERALSLDCVKSECLHKYFELFIDLPINSVKPRPYKVKASNQF